MYCGVLYWRGSAGCGGRRAHPNKCQCVFVVSTQSHSVGACHIAPRTPFPTTQCTVNKYEPFGISCVHRLRSGIRSSSVTVLGDACRLRWLDRWRSPVGGRRPRPRRGPGSHQAHRSLQTFVLLNSLATHPGTVVVSKISGSLILQRCCALEHGGSPAEGDKSSPITPKALTDHPQKATVFATLQQA